MFKRSENVDLRREHLQGFLSEARLGHDLNCHGLAGGAVHATVYLYSNSNSAAQSKWEGGL